MHSSDSNGAVDPSAIFHLKAAAVAHLSAFSSPGCHELAGNGSLVVCANDERILRPPLGFRDPLNILSNMQLRPNGNLREGDLEKMSPKLDHLQQQLSESMSCKRPLVAITGACALSMPGVLAFVPPAVPHVSRFSSILVRRVPMIKVPTGCRQHRRCFANMGSDDSEHGAVRKKVVFLGTPDVAALSLDLLLEASRQGKGGGFDVVRAVSNPPARTGRKKVLQPSPVQALAESAGIPVMTPATARDDEFLAELESLEPDLCITAAYGQFLPQRFLNIPKLGTLNIHPSLLPRYRGASPVQRCLEAGEPETGVTVAFTVLKMDAGPVVRQMVSEVS